MVKLNDFFQDLPLGINTLLREKAMNLSGSQKKLKIFWDLIRRPKILIIDESTNTIDNDWEQFLIKNLLKQIQENF